MYLLLEKETNKLILIFVFGVCLLLGLRDIAGLEINKFIIVVFCSICFFVSSFKNLVLMVSFLIPLLCGMPGTYLMPLVLLLVLTKYGIPKKSMLLILFFTCLEIFDSLFYTNFALNDTVQYCSFLGILFFFVYSTELKNNFKLQYDACRYYLYGSSFLCLAIFTSTIKTASDNWLTLFANGWFRFGDVQADEFSGMMLKLNANSLAYFACIGVFLALVYALNKKEKNKSLYYIIAAVHLIIGIFTVSRAFFILTLLSAVIIVFMSLKTKRQFLLLIFILLIITFFTIVGIHYLPNVVDGIVNRFEDKNIATAGGRTELLTAYFDAFFENPRFLLTGTGVLGYKEMIGIYGSIHNALQQLIICLGIPGSVLFLVGLIVPGIKDVKAVSNNMYILPLLVVGLFLQTIQILNPCQFMLPIAIGFLSLRLGRQK